ncbi:hypothetical protein CsSME_00042488 [Camellia sinensis var. sinensis]
MSTPRGWPSGKDLRIRSKALKDAFSTVVDHAAQNFSSFVYALDTSSGYSVHQGTSSSGLCVTDYKSNSAGGKPPCLQPPLEHHFPK